MVDRLLEAQKLQSGEKKYDFEAVPLEALVLDVVERMRPQAEDRLMQLSAHIGSDIPSIRLDAESISDAIRNLLDNAIKYSPAGTAVNVVVEARNGEVLITVIDQGVGVDVADRELIFDPFVRSRRGDAASVHGTGLGLALVKATAIAHGGKVGVSSNGDRGSRFTLILPGPARPTLANAAPAVAKTEQVMNGTAPPQLSSPPGGR